MAQNDHPTHQQWADALRTAANKEPDPSTANWWHYLADQNQNAADRASRARSR